MAQAVLLQERGQFKDEADGRDERPVREIERHARRGEAVLKCLLRHFQPDPAEEELAQLPRYFTDFVISRGGSSLFLTKVADKVK